jgi:hypothetical protein
MAIFKIEMSFPGEFLLRGIVARDYQEAVEKAEERFVELITHNCSSVSLPSPLRIELTYPLEGYAEQVDRDGKMLRSYHLEWTGASWEIEERGGGWGD